MKMKLISGSVSFIFFFVLLSCNQATDAITGSLLKAERYMEAHPDSALNVLQEIPHPEQLEGKAQADYGLLMTQALDKNYLPLESDSLIRLAIAYYEHSNDPVAKGKAYFYHGRYLLEAKKHREALDVFLKSKKNLEGTKQYKQLGLLSEYIGNINMEQHWYDEALLNQKEALRYYSIAKDTLPTSYALRNIGRAYLLKEELDSVYVYYGEALQLASTNGLKSEPSILQELSMIFRLTGDYEKAEKYILKSMEGGENKPFTHYLSLGTLYLQARKYDEAEKYLRMSLASPKLETLSNVYGGLYKLSMQKEDYKNVVTYIEKRDSIRSLLIDAEKKKDIIELQEKYRSEQLKNDYLQIRNNRNSVLLLSIIFILVALIVTIYYYYRSYNHKRRIREIEHTIRLNQKEIETYREELTEYSDSQVGHQNEIGELKGKISLLTNQNRDLSERLVVLGHDTALQDDSDFGLYIVAFRTLLSIKKGLLKRRLSDQDMEILVKLFNFLYSDYVDRLTAEFPGLTKHEIELCCLLKMKFSNQEVGLATNTAPDSVRKAKARLKNSLNIPANESLEGFLAKY